MKSRILSLLLIAATGSMADLAIPYNQTALDSSEVNAAYNAKAFSNEETKTELTSDGTSLKVSVTWGHSAGKDYGANAGILQPLNNMWAPVDFSEVTAIKFEYMTDAKTTAEFAPASPLYSGDKDNTGVMMLAELAAASAWKAKTISLPDGIAFLKWMTDADTKNGTGYAAQAWDDVKTQVKCLQFAPKPNYSTGTTLGLPATTSMSIKNLVVVGTVRSTAPGEWLTENGKGCTGTSVLLADFNSATPKKNYQGGWWYGFTDTTSGTVGAANGASALVTNDSTVEGMNFLAGDGTVGGVSGYVGITADLEKKISGTYHPYAGWADLGTGFKGPDGDIAVDLGTKFTSFSFDIVMGGDGGSFDETNLTGVMFKVGKASVGDSVQWHVGVPYGMNNGNICVDAGKLVQPSWYTSKLATSPVFKANDVAKLLWEIKIQNQDATLKSTTPTTSKGNSFYVGNVKLWNSAPLGISSRKIGGKSALVANYANGLVLSYALEGAASAKVDVVRMDGSKVASFDAPALASSRSFPMNLARGSYLAVVKGGKTSLVAPFAVAK